MSQLSSLISPTAQGSPSSVNAKKNNRLNAAGIALLNAQFLHDAKMPSPDVRRSLLEKINIIPGNEYYDMVHITSWFKRRLQRKRLSINQNSEFPSLTPEAIQHLKVLVKDQLNPDPTVVTTWASLLQATTEDVIGFIKLHSHAARLPTPAKTSTPEPSLTPVLPYQSGRPERGFKRDPINSPVIPPLSLLTSEVASSMTRYNRAQSKATPPLITPVSPPQQFYRKQPNMQPQTPPPPFHHDATLQAIVLGVSDAIASPNLPVNQPPTTAAEFEAMFAPYDKHMAQLLRTLQST